MLRRVILSLLLCLLFPLVANADNVVILSGGANFIPVNLFGAGSSFTAQGNDFSGFVSAHPTEVNNPGCWAQNSNSGCVLVKTDFQFAISGRSGLGGFTYQGVFHLIGPSFMPGVPPGTTASLNLAGSSPDVPIPAEFWFANQIEVIAPVQLSGSFGDTDLFGTLTGQAYGVFTFAQRTAPFGTSLQFIRADYFFLPPDATLPAVSIRAIPEPSTISLICLALGAFARRLCRNLSGSPTT